jgi:hypothetical protein
VTASAPPDGGPGASVASRRSSLWGRLRSVPGGDRSRLFSVLVILALVLVVASTATQAWFVFVVVPQQIRNSEPVVIDPANLLSNGPYVGCFVLLSGAGAVAHQGQTLEVSWNIVAPANASPSCTVQSVDWALGSLNVVGSNLPVTVPAGQVGIVQVFFAPMNYPFWGSVTVVVTETNP